MVTYINFSKILVVFFVALGLFVSVPTGLVYGATDYFLKIDGVEGESTKGTTGETSSVRVTATTTTQKAQFDTFIKIDGVEGDTKTPGVESDEIDAKVTDDPLEKGSVEFGWKVEEGEKGDTVDPSEGIKSRATTSATSTAPRGGVSVAAGDVNGLTEEEKEQFLMTVKSHAQVQSGQDLENFAKGILLSDENIKEVIEQEEKVAIKYKARGKFLGLIPVSYTEEVSVEATDTDSDGMVKVKVKLPWFSFLIKKDIKAGEIEEEIKKDGHEKWIELESWSFGEKAQIFMTLSNVLKTKHDTAKNSVNNTR